MVMRTLPAATRCTDPYDNGLLALAPTQAGRADVRLTSDKRDLLALRSRESTRVFAAPDVLTMHRSLPQ